MGPKVGKKDAMEDAWRSIIEEGVLNENGWNMKVVFLEAAGTEQDRMYLSKFETFAAAEKRFVIKCICKSETIFMINQLGSEKKTKDTNYRVFEEGQAYLKERKNIPSDVLALIIKHLILKMKEEYLFIKRQKLDVMEGLRQESLTMLGKEEVRGTVSSGVPRDISPPPPPPSTKSKGKSKEPVASPEPVEDKKYNTVLRERGEEWRDRIYVDDFPLDGPNLYIAVSGFTDPELPLCLIKIGIPITAIVQIRIDATITKVPSTLARKGRRGQSEAEVNTEKFSKFWEELQDLRIFENGAEVLKNTAFIIFRPPYWQSEQLSGNPDKIYDEISYLIYDVQDLSRQHVNYLNNMDIQNIPEHHVDERYYNCYNQGINDLPLESVTIYSVLDSLLQTACKENLNESSSSSLPTTKTLPNQVTRKRSTVLSTKESDVKVQTAKSLVKGIFNSLCKNDADKKKYRITYGEEYEASTDPIIIKYGDFVKNTTFHLNNIYLDNIVGSILFGMPLHNLWLKQEQLKQETEFKSSFHVNLLLSCFDREDVETAELIRMLHILSCRKLYNNRSSIKRYHLPSSTLKEFKCTYLKRSAIAEPLLRIPSLQENYSTRSPSFPSMTKSESIQTNESPEESKHRLSSESTRMKSLFYCPDISELVSAAEIANNQPINHMIDEFDFFEDFSGNCAYQVLLDAFNKFNCVDYKYCEVTDSIIMMFFNSHDKDGFFRAEWRVDICTPVCLQDFFDFALEENYEWIQNEEKIYDGTFKTRKHSVSQDAIAAFGAVSCIEDTNVEVDLLMEGSLKHQEMLEAEESDADTSEKDATIAKDGRKSVYSSSTCTDSKTFKRQSIYSRKSIYGLNNSNESLLEKPFLGYDLGDRRVEVFGKDAIFFSRDRTRLSSAYTLLIPYNVEYIVLNVVPGEESNEFWVHKALGDFISPEILKRCESFRINSKDNVMINITKQLYHMPLPLSTVSLQKLSKSKNDITGKNRPSMQSTQELPARLETSCYYSFCVTWPNGHITESVHGDNSPNISHIKQYYLEPLPHLDEDTRCISLEGEVIIFKTSGVIQVLCPDGKYFAITKYKKEVVRENLDAFSITTRPNGKAKQKDQSKDKGKEKNKPKVEVKPVEEVPPEYELFIDEFELIDTTGLRQKWIGDDSYDLEKLTLRVATDFCTGEVFLRRLDGTNSLLNRDGILVVTFPDKTRIISYVIVEPDEIFPEWTDEEKEFFDMLDSMKDSKDMSEKNSQSSSDSSSGSKNVNEEEPINKERTDGYISIQIKYTIEHENFTTVSIEKYNGAITIESPNNTSLNIDMFNHYKLNLGHNTTATFNGENLNIIYEACPECKSYTKCDIQILPINPTSSSIDNDVNPFWVKLKDSFCKKVAVDNEGNILLLDETCDDEVTEHTEETGIPEEPINNDAKVDWKSESSVASHGKCQDMYQAKNVRFIVMNRELKCSELVHQALLEQYKKDCHWKPFCFIKQYETFGDHRTLHSVLTPISITETEKWLMNSKMCNKPANLFFKDLKPESGKGFYHWMRPYERFQAQPATVDPVHTHKQPRAFVLRILEQQWRKEHSEDLKGGKELLTAILRYRRYIESESETMLHIPIIDVRLDEERKSDLELQAVACRVHGKLKALLEEDVELRAKATITTKSPLPSEYMSVEGEIEDECKDPYKLLEEERIQTVKEVEEAWKQSPNLQRYWRRRAEELKEEEFYLFLLREGTVPQYFRNVLGGAIWWEVDHLTDEAVETARRRKMKCVCAESGEGTSHSDAAKSTFQTT